MRHFSGEFEGLQLLMLDELDAIAGGDGEDTDDGSTPTTEEPQPDIVVYGIRQDPTDRLEQLLEREWWLSSYMVQGKFANAEMENGQWVIRGADAPTQDQKDFKSNYDKVHGSLWGHLNETQQASLASEFTDLGFDLAANNVDVGLAYSNYGSLLGSGAVQGSSAHDFASWVAQGGR